MRDRRIGLPPDVFPPKILKFTAVRAGNLENSLIATPVGGVHTAQPLNRRRSAEDHLAAGEGFRAFLEKGDRVALPVEVGVAVVRLFDGHDRGRRRFHRCSRVRAHKLQEAAGEELHRPTVVRAFPVRDRNARAEVGRDLHHRDEFLLVELLGRLFLRKHHDHRARIHADPLGDVVEEDTVGPRDLRGLASDDLHDRRIIQCVVHAGHPGRYRHVPSPRHGRTLR